MVVAGAARARGHPARGPRALAEEHLLNPRRYRARFGVPSVSMEEPSFRAGFNAYRTWRGAAWVNTAWFMVGGLRALGAGDEADRLAQGVADAATRSGFREYYHPRTGSGHGERASAGRRCCSTCRPGFRSPRQG